MQKIVIIISFLLFGRIGFGQNVSQYFDDGIEDNLGLFISVNSLQLLTGHKGVTIEKNITPSISGGVEFGFTGSKLNTYNAANFLSEESPLNTPKSSLYYCVSINYQLKLMGDYGQIGLRYKNYHVTLNNGKKSSMQEYDILSGKKILLQHHIFFHFFYGIGLRFADQPINSSTTITSKQAVSFQIPVGFSVGFYL